MDIPLDLKDELAKVLRERANLDQPTSERAAEVALEFAKEHGPELLSRLGLGDLGKGLGGLLGR
jgi:hypothetical protein